jgi:hypothetical protein
MGLRRRSLTAVGAGLSTAVLAITMGVPAQAATTPGWRIFSRPFGGSARFSAFWAVTAISRHDAWAVGGGTTPAAEHWNGRKWRTSPLPTGLNSAINAVSASSSKDVWAVSDMGGYILHFNGTRWYVVKRFSGFGELTGVTAFSPTNVWVFGGPGGAPGFGTWRYNGHSWKRDGAATKSGIGSVSAVSPSDMWAIGSRTSPLDSIVHYTGTWRRERSAALAGLQFDGILALSKRNVWATAAIQTHGSRPHLVHLTGGRWVKTKIPWAVGPAFDLASDGHGGLWLTAFSAVSAATGYWEIHRSASGRWSRTRIASAAVFDVTRIPGTTSLWGAGYVQGKTNSSAAIFAYGRVR